MRKFILQPLAMAVLAVLIYSCSSKSEINNAEPVAEENTQRMFDLISPNQTGIHFANNLQEDLVTNIFNYEYYYNGGGVAIGDINNDGLPDIYFSGTKVENKLYLNKGNFQFEDITASAGVGGGEGFKTGVTMVDINGDGLLDIYVCKTGKFNSSARTNLLYINNGDLAFTDEAAAYGLNDSSFSNYATFFDMDKDGDLDMFLVNHPVDFPSANTIRIKQGANGIEKVKPDNYDLVSDRMYKNNGNGTFSDITKAAGMLSYSYGFMATIMDVNEDGLPDLFVTNDYVEPDFLYINKGNGTFKESLKEYFRHTSHFSMGTDIADINNDGHLDVMVLDMIPETNRRQKMLENVLKYDRYDMQVKYGYYHQLMRNTLQLNNGNGSFSEIGTMAGVSNTDWSWGPLFADFDNDGLVDLFVSNGYRRDVTDLDYMKFTVDSLNRNGGVTVSNIDEILKLVPSEKISNYMYKNNGDYSFSNNTMQWGLQQPTFSNGCAYADLDNDGDLDLVINNIDEVAHVYQNKSELVSKKNYLNIQLEGPQKNRSGIGSWIKLNSKNGQQTTYVTPSHGFFSSTANGNHFGLGDLTTVDKIEIIWPDGKMQVLNDISANQQLKIKYADADQMYQKEKPTPALYTEVKNSGIDYTHIENDFIDFKREPLLPHQFSKNGPGMAVGDVNDDGMEDVYIGGANGSAGVLYLQNSNGTFRKNAQPAFAADAVHEDMGAIFFDANGDGFQDLYVVSGGSEFIESASEYQDRLYINNGKGGFEKKNDLLPQINASGSCVVAADYDKDGDLDLFVGGRIIPGKYPMSPKSYLLRNENGKFTDVTNDVAPGLQNLGLISSAIWSDYNNDGQIDLVVTGEWLPITFYKNNNGKFTNETANTGLAKSNGWWNSIISGDFDNDGDIDYVAGNMGLNSRIKANESQPASIYFKDFDQNGFLDAIMTTFVQGIAYPLPLRDQILDQLRMLRKRFTRYSQYANATIENVFTPEELRDAGKLMSYNFNSSFIKNIGNGQFEIHSLPVEAQFAPVYGILAKDMDEDGNLDIVAVGNNFTSDVLSGRYDAGNGLVLQGDGKGNFVNQKIAKTGFYNPGNAKAITKLSSGNKELILISNNNDKVKTFEKNMIEEQTEIVLNNDDAWGVLELSNGTNRKVEFDYGTGYLSQSQRKIFLPSNIKKATIYNYKGNSRTVVPSAQVLSQVNK